MRIDSQIAVLDALNDFRLKEYDWNGSGGLPLRGDVGTTIKDLFSDADILGSNLLMSLPTPDLSMAANGTVEMAFEYDDNDDGERKLFVTIECDGVLSYIKVYEDGQTSVEGVIRLDFLGNAFRPDDFVELTELLRWFLSE